MNRKRDTALTVAAILSFAVIHFAASFFVAFVGGILGGAYVVAGYILLFPLSLWQGPDSAVLGWLGWALISLVWGWGLYTLSLFLAQSLRRKA